jgi:hypothetical protein
MLGFDDYDCEAEELRIQQRLEKQRRNILALHPDCRDPDHPGCENCMEGDHDEATA